MRVKGNGNGNGNGEKPEAFDFEGRKTVER